MLTRRPIVTTIAEGWLDAAARRWPEELRNDQRREWAAELTALGTEPGVGSVTRAIRQLRFAASLAWSRPVEAAGAAPNGAGARLAGLGAVAMPVLALLAAPFFAAVGHAGLTLLARLLLETIPGYGGGVGPAGDQIDVAAHVVAVTCVVGSAVVMAAAGALLGPRLPLPPVLAATVTALLVGLGAGVVLLGQESSIGDQGGTRVYPLPGYVAALAVWVPLVAVLGWAVHRQMDRGRRLAAALLAVVGGLLVSDAAASAAEMRVAAGRVPWATAPLWFPASLLDNSTRIAPGDRWNPTAALPAIVGELGSVSRLLVLATAFVLPCLALAARRAAIVAPAMTAPTAGDPPTRETPAAATRWRRRAGATAVAVGLPTWAYVLTLLTPQIDHWQSPYTASLPVEYHLDAQDLRQSLILLIVVGFVALTVDIGRPLVPALLLGAALLVADTGLDASKAAGGRALFAATALGAVLTVAAGGLVGMLGPPPRTRDTVIGIAVLAAFVAPALFARTHRGDAFQDPLSPVGVSVSAILVTVLLAVVAVGCALAARPESMRPAAQVALVATPVLVLGTGAAVAWLRGAGGITGTDLSYAPLAAGLGPLFVAYVTAVARSPRPRRRSDTATIRVLSALGLLLMALPVLIAQAVAGIELGTPLMKLAGYGPPPDGTPYLPGAVALGLLLAGIAAARVRRRAAAEPSPASPPAPAATVR